PAPRCFPRRFPHPRHQTRVTAQRFFVVKASDLSDLGQHHHSPVADAPAPIASPPAPPPRETPARTRTPPPPPAPLGRGTAKNICAAPAFRCSPAPPVRFCLLLPAPSCNRISGEDLRQRGSSRASFRACASRTYSSLGGTPFLVFITSERSVLCAAKDPG